MSVRKLFIFPLLFAVVFPGEGALLQTATPTSSPPSNGSIGFVGCSFTNNAVSGYHMLGGKRFWETIPQYNGGSVAVWAGDTNNRYWAGFDAALTAHPDTTVIWWQLCNSSADHEEALYDHARFVLEEILRRVPEVPAYVSAQHAYSGGHVCRGEEEGPARMQRLADRLAAEGLALAGPAMGPLAAEQTRDGCHANSAGMRVLGQQLLDFFEQAAGEAASLPPGGALDSNDLPFPLDLDASGTYKGLPLTLQDNGEPTVTPVDGLIGVVCIGMSNASQECGDFIEKWRSGAFAGEVNPQVRFVNCAVGGHAIERWNDPAEDAQLWDACIERKIRAQGLRADQVRVLWHKAADQFTADPHGTVYPPYPDPNSDYFRFYDNLTAFASRVREKFPSVQAVYTTSRSYGGFASKPTRGEPLSYEEGLALNQWLVDHPTVDGVWYGWGPYIWAPDCATGVTNGSGVCYVRQDYQADGVHPAQGARDKISLMLHQRWSQDGWYQS